MPKRTSLIPISGGELIPSVEMGNSRARRHRVIHVALDDSDYRMFQRAVQIKRRERPKLSAATHAAEVLVGYALYVVNQPLSPAAINEILP